MRKEMRNKLSILFSFILNFLGIKCEWTSINKEMKKVINEKL